MHKNKLNIFIWSTYRNKIMLRVVATIDWMTGSDGTMYDVFLSHDQSPSKHDLYLFSQTFSSAKNYYHLTLLDHNLKPPRKFRNRWYAPWEGYNGALKFLFLHLNITCLITVKDMKFGTLMKDKVQIWIKVRNLWCAPWEGYRAGSKNCYFNKLYKILFTDEG